MAIHRQPDPFNDYQGKVEKYIRSRDWHSIAELKGQDFKVVPLAKGEYNLNYLPGRPLIINTTSYIRQTLQRYMNIDFIRSLFSPFMQQN